MTQSIAILQFFMAIMSSCLKFNFYKPSQGAYRFTK